MRLTRTIILLAGTALAVMAMSVTTASAQETEVEVLNEHTGDPCNPCTIHFSGETILTALPSGMVVSQCEDEYEGTLGTNRNGEITWFGTTHGDPGCRFVNCSVTPGEGHWPITGLGETGAGEEHAHILMCLAVPPSGPQVHCLLEANFADTGTTQDRNHNYEMATHTLCAGTRELEARWLQETVNHDEIELVHHPAP